MALTVVLLALATAAAPAARPGFRYENTTADAEVGLTIDRAVGSWPELHRKLWREDRAELAKFAAGAKGQKRDRIKDGWTDPPAYGNELSWEVSAASPRLVSLSGTWYDFSGGAHPNHGYRVLLWSPAAKRTVKPAELFKPPSKADAAVDRALCQGIERARREKGVEPDAGTREMWPCPKFRAVKFALLPANTGGGFGGLQFLFDPYESGSYAEGEYEVVLPQSVMRPVIAPAWGGAFAGKPKPPKRKD